MDIGVASIDTGVPIPERVSLLNIMRGLKPGESFVFPLNKRSQVQTYASKLKRELGQSYTVRKQGEVCRVWRND